MQSKWRICVWDTAVLIQRHGWVDRQLPALCRQVWTCRVSGPSNNLIFTNQSLTLDKNIGSISFSFLKIILVWKRWTDYSSQSKKKKKLSLLNRFIWRWEEKVGSIVRFSFNQSSSKFCFVLFCFFFVVCFDFWNRGRCRLRKVIRESDLLNEMPLLAG